ncbi:MAG: hypothetical protein ACLVJ6_00660 [Merdibacter sp.]
MPDRYQVGMLGAGVGGSFRFDAVEATLSSSVSILSATLNARVGEVALKVRRMPPAGCGR